MKYEIKIWSRGIDVGIGKITKEQYDYWSEREVYELEEALNDNFDYEENETPDEARLPYEYYNEYTDVFFGYGPDFDYNEMTIIDENENVVYEGDVSSFIEEHDPDYEHDLIEPGDRDYYVAWLEPGHYVQWCQGGKGLYFDGEFETQETFNPLKMKFSRRETDFGEILTGIAYDGEDLENQAGDYDIKSFEASIHEVT